MSTADGRSTRWDEHRLSRRKELVEATLRAIREHGAGVGMDDIAAAAGTSKTVFYRHFVDRAGLYAAVAESVNALILRDVTSALGSVGRPALTELPGTPRALVAAAIDAYLRLVERDPEVYRFVVSAPILDRPPGGDPALAVTHHVADQVTAVLRRALEAGGGDVSAAPVWGAGLVGMVRAAADQWLAGRGGLTREQLAEHLTALAWSGLSAAWPATTGEHR